MKGDVGIVESILLNLRSHVAEKKGELDEEMNKHIEFFRRTFADKGGKVLAAAGPVNPNKSRQKYNTAGVGAIKHLDKENNDQGNSMVVGKRKSDEKPGELKRLSSGSDISKKICTRIKTADDFMSICMSKTVKILRVELKQLNLATTGLKKELAVRLATEMASQENIQLKENDTMEEDVYSDTAAEEDDSLSVEMNVECEPGREKARTSDPITESINESEPEAIEERKSFASSMLTDVSLVEVIDVTDDIDEEMVLLAEQEACLAQERIEQERQEAEHLEYEEGLLREKLRLETALKLKQEEFLKKQVLLEQRLEEQRQREESERSAMLAEEAKHVFTPQKPQDLKEETSPLRIESSIFESTPQRKEASIESLPRRGSLQDGSKSDSDTSENRQLALRQEMEARIRRMSSTTSIESSTATHDELILLEANLLRVEARKRAMEKLQSENSGELQLVDQSLLVQDVVMKDVKDEVPVAPMYNKPAMEVKRQPTNIVRGPLSFVPSSFAPVLKPKSAIPSIQQAEKSKAEMERKKKEREEKQKHFQTQRQLAKNGIEYSNSSSLSISNSIPPKPFFKPPTSKKKIREWRQEDNYEISDKGEGSGDESDSDEKNKKPIPDWARKDNLHNALRIQFAVGNPIDPDEIFGEIPKPDLEAIFKQKKKKAYRPRGSSAQWEKDGLNEMEKMKYRKDLGLE